MQDLAIHQEQAADRAALRRNVRPKLRTHALALAAGLALTATLAQAQEQKPNILFIMSDDHTTQALGCYGSRLAKLNPTPTLDKLAAEGMRFDRVFCTNSICTPSRATI